MTVLHLLINEEKFTITRVCDYQLEQIRCKKKWHKILQEYFLLNENDYDIETRGNVAEWLYEVTASFSKSACGRYAFWRLTNGQAPDALKDLEDAHKPHRKLILLTNNGEINDRRE